MPTRATKKSASSRPPSPKKLLLVELIGAPVLVTPTTPFPNTPLLLPPSMPTHRPSTLKVRLLVKAHSTPPPSAQPTLSLLRRPRKPVVPTVPPAWAAAFDT